MTPPNLHAPSQPDTHRMLPQSQDAELGLLGSILLKPDEVLSEIVGKIKPAHFHAPAHATIYSIILELWTASKPIDFILLTQVLRDRGALDHVGGPAFVTSLFTYVPTAANAPYYVMVILEKYALRGMIVTCADYMERAYDNPEDYKALLGGLASDIAAFSVANDEERKAFKALIVDKLQRLEDAADGKTPEIDPSIVLTGIPWLDKESPLRLKGMPVIAAPTKVGKTTRAVNIAKNVAANKWPVIYFILEATQEEIFELIFMNESRVPEHRQWAGMSNGEFDRVGKASATMASWQIEIVDNVYDLGGIVANIKKWKAQNPEGKLAVIDYVQLVQGERKKGANREEEIAGISRTFRLLGKELNIAMILLSQLNNDGATRESRALENDCTALWKLLRCFKERKSKHEEPEEERGKRLLTIPFQRKGASGIACPVAFLGDIARIEELAQEPEQ